MSDENVFTLNAPNVDCGIGVNADPNFEPQCSCKTKNESEKKMTRNNTPMPSVDEMWDAPATNQHGPLIPVADDGLDHRTRQLLAKQRGNGMTRNGRPVVDRRDVLPSPDSHW